jgi:hypothetical protein
MQLSNVEIPSQTLYPPASLFIRFRPLRREQLKLADIAFLWGIKKSALTTRLRDGLGLALVTT